MLKILKRAKLLYAEDCKHTQKATLKVLSRYFDDITVVHDGKEAVKKLEESKYDIAILDIVMPMTNGWDVAKRIRELDEDMPIIITTGHTKVDELILGVRLNIVDFLQKPYSLELLTSALARATKSLAKKFESNLVYILDNVHYDVINAKMINNGADVALTKSEAILLELLLSNRKTVVTYQMIEQSLYHNKEYVSISAVKSLILRLRKKIGQDVIANISGVGYRIERREK